jgi:acrylyl-CoA reductase (NADPH)
LSDESFSALVLRQQDGKTMAAVETLSEAELPDGDTLVAVDYSTVNYKDALAVTGKGKIVRTWPMVPGIDFAGTVLHCTSDRYSKGDRVVLTGWSVGERYWGGYSQRQRVRSEWLVPLVEGLDARQAMAIGTAGLTAMLCVMELEQAGIGAEDGTVLVSGATGGVGSVAVAILAKLGYTVAALTGKDDASDYLKGLGASEVVSGPEWSESPRPLEAQRWAAAVDSVGNRVLARILAEANYGGAVAACGLAGGAELATTVMPFILRGVRLLGVDSVMCPYERRLAAWKRLAEDLPRDTLDRVGQRIVGLGQTPQVCEDLLNRKIQGRVLVDVNA